MAGTIEGRDGPKWPARRILTELMEPVERRAVAERMLKHGGVELLNSLAEAARFRRQTLERMPNERLLRKLESLMLDPRLEPALHTGLAEYHLNERSLLMAAFLDSWGISHEKGHISAKEVTPPSPEAALEAIEELGEQFPMRGVMTYFATAGLLMGGEDSRWRESLWPIVESFVRESGDEEQCAEMHSVSQPGDEGRAFGADAESTRLDSFTTLDRVLIRQIDASLSGIEGSLSIDEVTDLVEEVIQLNAERHRSYYHRGFLRALLGDEVDFDASERSGHRRGWLLSGRVMALARRLEWEKLASLYDERRAAIEELLAPEGKAPIPRYVSSARKQIFHALWETGRRSEAIASLDPRVVAALGEGFVYRLRKDGTKLLRERRPAEATQCFDLVRRAITRFLPAEEALPPEFLAELDRRRAQCLRSLGRFAEAQKEFERLLGAAETRERGPLLVDVGLAVGRFRSLTDVKAPRDREDVPGMLERLEKGMRLYREALGVEGQRTNAHYVLGVLAMLEERFEAAVHHLELAYLGAGERSVDYMQGGLYDQIRLYHALCILLSLDESRLGYAVDLLESVHERLPTTSWPEWLVRRASEVVELGTSDSIRLMRFFVGAMPRVADLHLRNGVHLERVPELESRLVRRAQASERSLENRFQDLDCLVKHRIRQGRHDDACASLDAIELLGRKSKECRAKLLAALRDSTYAPAWSEQEMMSLRALLLEMDGELEQAGSVLLNLVYQHASREEWDEAIGLAERIAGYGAAAHGACEDARRRVESEVARRVEEEAATGPIESADPVRILFVGGNETQARYDEEVRGRLRERFGSLEVEFEHTGWGSNWGRYLEDMQPRLERCHGIVIMHFIRTQLGRSLRRKAGDLQLPWGACTGHGRDAMVGSIERLAKRILEERE